MHPKQQKRLSKKGWSKKEIDHSVHLLKNAKQKHLPIKRDLHHLGFSLLLLVLFFGSIILTVYSVPLLLNFTSQYVYLIAVIIGLIAGLFFTFIINEIEFLDKKHHIILLLFLLMLILINAIIMLGISNRLQKKLNYDLDVVVLVFAAFFLVPYLYNLVKK